MTLLQLFLCFCLFQAVPAFAKYTPQKCSPNQVTLINLENQYEIKISELDLNVAFDRLDVLGETSTPNVTEILLKSADVVVSGHLYPKENYTDSKIARSFNTSSVIVHLTQENSDNKQLSCKVASGKYLSKRNARSQSSLTPQERIEFVLHGLTESCLEIQICQQFNAMLSDAARIRDYYEQKLTIALAPQRSFADQIFKRNLLTDQEKALQNAINSLLDFGLAAALTKLVDSDGIYHFPDVETSFSAAGSTGDFEATDGTFEGLTTMKRVTDIVFTNNENRYTIGSTFRLSKAKVNIPTYHARYGYVNIDGHVILDIHGISLTIKVSLDYNSRPCKMQLNEMSIHDVGDVDVDIDGLGWPLNNILKPVIRNIVKTTVFEKAKEAIAEQASQFNCEQFRPTIEIGK